MFKTSTRAGQDPGIYNMFGKYKNVVRKSSHIDCRIKIRSGTQNITEWFNHLMKKPIKPLYASPLHALLQEPITACQVVAVTV